MGLLLFSGAASNAITLTQGVASIPRVAKRLHQWFLERFAGGVKTDEPDNKFQLSYQSSKGHGALTLNEAPSLEVLTHWLAATYAILEGDAENRQ